MARYCRMVVVRWLLVDVINEFSVDTEFHNERVVALLLSTTIVVVVVLITIISTKLVSCW